MKLILIPKEIKIGKELASKVEKKAAQPALPANTAQPALLIPFNLKDCVPADELADAERGARHRARPVLQGDGALVRERCGDRGAAHRLARGCAD